MILCDLCFAINIQRKRKRRQVEVGENAIKESADAEITKESGDAEITFKVFFFVNLRVFM